MSQSTVQLPPNLGESRCPCCRCEVPRLVFQERCLRTGLDSVRVVQVLDLVPHPRTARSQSELVSAMRGVSTWWFPIWFASITSAQWVCFRFLAGLTASYVESNWLLRIRLYFLLIDLQGRKTIMQSKTTVESLSLWCTIWNISKILERSEPPESFLLWSTG